MRLLLTSLLLATLAAPAQAVTVRFTPGEGRFGGPYLDVEAAPGERNDMTVETNATHEVVVADAANDVATAAPCRQDGPRRAICPPSRVSVALGDAPDRIFVRGNFSGGPSIHLGEGDDVAESGEGTVYGGPGADRMTGRAQLLGQEGDDSIEGWQGDGGPGHDVLQGLDGRDELSGGPGNDRLMGGGGDDSLEAGEGVLRETPDGPPGTDVVDGGDGSDTLTYGRALAGVTVDLRAPAPEGDRVKGIEHAVGSIFDDRLIGTDDGERLYGISGRDLIDGRGGDDDLFGAGQPDHLIGGDGDDRLTAAPGSVTDAGAGDDRLRVFHRYGGRQSYPAAYDCGPGRDVVLEPAWTSRIPASCERVGFVLGSRFASVPRPRPGRVPVVCPVRTGGGCLIVVQARRGKRVVQRRRVRLGIGRRATVHVSGGTAVRVVVRTRFTGRVTYGVRF